MTHPALTPKMVTDEMVEQLARFLAKPTDEDLWLWRQGKELEDKYIEAHWRDYEDDAREYIQLVAPMIVEREREECAKIADSIAEQERGNPGEIWAERIADAIRERMP